MKALTAVLTDPADQTVGAFSVVGREILVGINLVRTSGSVVVTVLGYDPIVNKTWTLLASASLSSTAYTTLSIGPSITAAADVAAAVVVPRQIKILIDVTALVGTIQLTAEGVLPTVA